MHSPRKVQEAVAIDAHADHIVRVCGIVRREGGVVDRPNVRGISDVAASDGHIAIRIARTLVVVRDELIIADGYERLNLERRRIYVIIESTVIRAGIAVRDRDSMYE